MDDTTPVESGPFEMPAVEPPPVGPGPDWHRSLQRNGNTIVSFAIVLLLFAVGSASVAGFLSTYNVDSLLSLASFLGIAAAGQTIVILLGGIDMSIPNVITMGDVMLPQLHAMGVPMPLTILAVLVIAAVVGALNGVISSRLRIHPLIVTLGIGSMLEGAGLAFTGGVPRGNAPAWLTNLASAGGHVLGVQFPPSALVWLAVSAGVIVLLGRTPLGRSIYATGANPRAAEFARVHRVGVWVATYMLSAVLASVAGMLLAGFSGSGYFGIGDPYLFVSVGAVVIGGTSLLGGRGGYFGTIAGALALTEIGTILVGYGLDSPTQQIIYGLLVLLMIGVYGRERHVRERI